MKKISAAAISRILNSAGIKKALPGTGYSTGFEVVGLSVVANVYYTPRTIDDMDTELKRIVDLINQHKGKKYVAKIVGTTVEVRIREEEPEEPQSLLSQEEEAEAAKEPLMALREAVEANDLAFMTRKAGPTSIFVYYLVPFKDKLRRLEVFYSGGCYASYGQFGGPGRHEFFNTRNLIGFIRDEIAD